MKVLFLDVDGVLNSAEWFQEDRRRDGDYLGLRSVNPAAVKMINYVLRTTGAMLVLSSTWRLVDDYVQTLKDFGLPIVAKTPVLHSSNRGEEIRAWLDTHPGVTHFAIIDDDADAGDCGLRDHFVRTTFQRGLEMAHVDRLLQLLGATASATSPKA
jgi:Swiss Army Knife RNA repair-like protein